MSIQFNRVKEILKTNIMQNKSGVKVVLSVGESLLFVLDICKKEKIDPSIIDQLNRLYIEGIKTDKDKLYIRKIKEILADKNFVVKSDAKTINDDPSRRYFETNLAYHILKNKTELLDHSELEKFTKKLKNRLLSLPSSNLSLHMLVEKILTGDMDKHVLNTYQMEYSELTHKLLTNNFYGLSEISCKNLYQIACSTILATLNTQFDQSMPADIYSDSIFTMGMDGRGRVVKPYHQEVKTTAKGLMKSISPLPMYHDLVNPVEENYEGDVRSPLQRSADQADFMIESQWSQHLFSRQTQPYSNGISSTTLAQIRNIILQKRQGNPHFSSTFQEYMTSFAALMLYNSGGHSFFEIFEVFKLSLCRELLGEESGLQEALSDDSLMYKLLYLDQKEAFEIALQSTQEYMHTLLNKKILNAEFKYDAELKLVNKEINDENADLLIKQPEVHHAVLNSSPEGFNELIQKLDKNDVDVLNDKGWTALMVASQLGKTDYVTKLLDVGADISKQVDNLSSLELAIKNQNYATVIALLERGAKLKVNNKSGLTLKERSPSLYLACRQSDMRILKVMMERKNEFNIVDKKDAILTALKVENLEALKLLINYIGPEEKQKNFSGKFKYFLLKEALTLGNVEFIKGIISLETNLASEHINYDELLSISAEKGFLPTAKYLLKLSTKDLKKQDNQTSSIDLDKALIIALEHNHFDLAVFFIIYGANPELIPASGSYLKPFNLYLKHAKYFDFLFTDTDRENINQRREHINQVLDERKNSTLHEFLTNFVEFLNRILPVEWELGYNDKTHIIANVSRVFDNKINVDASSDESKDLEEEPSDKGSKMLRSLSFFGGSEDTLKKSKVELENIENLDEKDSFKY